MPKKKTYPISKAQLQQSAAKYGFYVHNANVSFIPYWYAIKTDILLVYEIEVIINGIPKFLRFSNHVNTSFLAILRWGDRLLEYKKKILEKQLKLKYNQYNIKAGSHRILMVKLDPKGTLLTALGFRDYKELAKQAGFVP